MLLQYIRAKSSPQNNRIYSPRNINRFPQQQLPGLNKLPEVTPVFVAENIQVRISIHVSTRDVRELLAYQGGKMKFLIFVLLTLSLNVYAADECNTKAIKAVQALGNINGFGLLDVKVTGWVMTEGDGTRLQLSARDLHDHPYAFTADVGQSEGPCLVLSVNVTQFP